MKKNDVVNHPSHYTDGNIEVIDFIEDKGLGFCLGNAVKYISRAGKKYPDKEIEDLEKAIWYIKRRIKELKSGEPEKINERLEEMIEKEGLNKDLTPECPEVKVVPLGKSKDGIDKLAKTVKPIRGLRAKSDVYDEIMPTVDDTATRVLSKEEEDKVWNNLYDIMHSIDPKYTREQFEKDLDEAKQTVKKEMPTLMDFSKLFK